MDEEKVLSQQFRQGSGNYLLFHQNKKEEEGYYLSFWTLSRQFVGQPILLMFVKICWNLDIERISYTRGKSTWKKRRHIC